MTAKKAKRIDLFLVNVLVGCARSGDRFAQSRADGEDRRTADG
jgi:hypothetical protein